MKHLLWLLAIPFILLWQVIAFSTLSELQEDVYRMSAEVEELDAHQTRAAQQKRYHENRVSFFSLKVKEIEAAKEHRKHVLTLRQLELYNRQATYTAEKGEVPQELFDTGGTSTHQWKKPFNLDHLAWSVAGAETNHCAKWYGKSYNNCFGIRNWNTAPCPKVGINRMCIYERPEDSYEAFKKIRSTRYKWRPDMNKARKRTGNDHASTRLANVNHLYHNN